jgi:hypothetical protein
MRSCSFIHTLAALVCELAGTRPPLPPPSCCSKKERSGRRAAGARTARAATANMPPSLAVRREGERVPELPLAPLLNETPKRSLRGRWATRMAALGGAKRRPASAGDAAWKISLGSSRPWRAGRAASAARGCGRRQGAQAAARRRHCAAAPQQRALRAPLPRPSMSSTLTIPKPAWRPGERWLLSGASPAADRDPPCPSERGPRRHLRA